jgi:homoserine dehydrogenase
MENDEKTLVAPVVLNGPGRVGKEFIRLLAEEASGIKERTGCLPVLRAVFSRRGILFSHEGLSLNEVLGWLDSDSGQVAAGVWPWLEGRAGEGRLSAFAVADYPLVLDLVRGEVPGVVVEATTTDLETGEPGLSHLIAAMEKGFSAVCLAKGPLVVAFGKLTALAKERRVSLRYSGAVAAALPTVDTATYSMAGAGIVEIEGVLNGTTNFILNSMAAGKSYADALAAAQVMGVAEANPRLDVEGFDSAAKLLIIANTVWGLSLELSAVERQGISGLDASCVQRSAEKGMPVRLLARAALPEFPATPGTGARTPGGTPMPLLTVRPEAVPPGHPFVNLPGTSKAVRFKSRNMGEVIVSGGASDVTGAAASALKDLIHVLQDRR